MGLGITNASTGGGGATFSATLQIATDANAVITAVNLAGDTFSGTANSSGSLILTITEPGTYTVTETDGGVESIVIADNGETYTIEVVAFDGKIIEDGLDPNNIMEAVGIAYSPYPAAVPTLTRGEQFENDITYDVVFIYVPNSKAGAYRSNITINTNQFSSIKLSCWVNTYFYVAFFDENDNIEWSQYITSSGMHYNTPLTITGFPSGRYRIGVLQVSGGTFAINDFTLQR